MDGEFICPENIGSNNPRLWSLRGGRSLKKVGATGFKSFPVISDGSTINATPPTEMAMLVVTLPMMALTPRRRQVCRAPESHGVNTTSLMASPAASCKSAAVKGRSPKLSRRQWNRYFSRASVRLPSLPATSAIIHSPLDQSVLCLGHPETVGDFPDQPSRLCHLARIASRLREFERQRNPSQRVLALIIPSWPEVISQIAIISCRNPAASVNRERCICKRMPTMATPLHHGKKTPEVKVSDSRCCFAVYGR